MTRGLMAPSERAERSAAKQRAVLRWLRDETWSTPQVLGKVMGMHARPSAYKALSLLEKNGLLSSTELQIAGKVTQRVFGITAHGLALAYEPDEPYVQRPTFEPSKLRLTTFQHEIDIQLLRQKAEESGWHEWVPGTRLGASQYGEKRPDAVAIDSQNKVVAIEVERTIKTKKRYEVLLSQYLQLAAKGRIHRVVWLCPSLDLALRLRRIITSITAVPVQGQRIPLEPRHYSLLEFNCYNEWLAPSKNEVELHSDRQSPGSAMPSLQNSIERN